MYQPACAYIRVLIVSTNIAIELQNQVIILINSICIFDNLCVFHWLILIPKRGSFDPNLKRGTFDQSKYLLNCDVTIISNVSILIRVLISDLYFWNIKTVDKILHIWALFWNKLWTPEMLEKMKKVVDRLLLILIAKKKFPINFAKIELFSL